VSGSSGTANAAVTKQSWNACHALGRVLAAVKGPVLAAALAHAARLSHGSSSSSSSGGHASGCAAAVSASGGLGSSLSNSDSRSLPPRRGTEHAFGRLEAGGGGGGNGDDVLAARWAQRRRRRLLGQSGALPWFDGALAALTAVLAKRLSSQAAFPDCPSFNLSRRLHFTFLSFVVLYIHVFVFFISLAATSRSASTPPQPSKLRARPKPTAAC
jgi:hypothetical protein